MEPESSESRHQNPVGDSCKIMKRTSPSMSYRDLQNTLDEGFAEQRHRDLWLFLYSSRHATPELWQLHSARDLDTQEREELFHEANLLLEKFSSSGQPQLSSNDENYPAKLDKFCFGLICAFHKRLLADGFTDIRFETQRADYDNVINNLTRDEIAVVSRLHELTYKYGFVITELLNSLIDSPKLIDAFIIRNLEIHDINQIPSFTFPKKGSHPQGIQISTKEYQTEINEPWDLVVFINEKDTLSNIKEELSKSWKDPGSQVVGDQNQQKISFYVDRGKCNLRNLIDTIRLQIDHLNSYNNGLSLIAEPEYLGAFKKNKAKAEKEAKRNLSSTIDRLRLTEGLLSKRWSVKKSNIRRSIGLYLWDQKNIIETSRSRKNIIIDLIDEIKYERPEALEFYLKNFNKYDSPEQTKKFGDSADALETVTREMEADFELTDICIRNFEFLAPQDVKSRRRKS